MRLTPPTVAIALLLLCLPGALALWPYALKAPGIDLFRYWAIPLAHAEQPQQLGSPYRASADYAAALAKRAARDESGDLQRLAAAALPFDLTASPLLYYLHALAPPDYVGFRQLMSRAQILALWSLLAYLTIACGTRLWIALPYATLTTLVCDPLILDVNVGNTNSLQLFALTAGIALQARVASTQAVHLFALALLYAAIALFKPTLLLPVVLLASLRTCECNWRQRTVWILALVIAGSVLLLLPAAFFGGAAVWSDWVGELTASDTRLAYPMAAGNLSTSAWAAATFGWPVGRSVVLGLCALCAMAGAVSLVRRQTRTSQSSREAPYLLAGLGIAATLALSPLVWSHYLVLLLLPVTWLIFSPVSPRSAQWLGVIGLVLLVGGARRLYALDIGLTSGGVALLSMVCWIPVWIGLLLCWRTQVPGDGGSTVNTPRLASAVTDRDGLRVNR